MRMRSLATVTPLPDTNPPGIASATGLGAGGGASVFAPLGSGSFDVLLQLGAAPASSGSVILKFASAPPTLFVGAHDGFGTVTVSGQGTTTVTLSWTGARLPAGGHETIHCEWSVSK